MNPEKNIQYVRSNAEFWMENAYDPVFGGFFSNVDQHGNVTTMIPQRPGFGNTPYKRKSLIAQSRHGYGFTRAFMLTGDEKYLMYAKSALDFLCDHGWDSVNEGWYCFAKSDGTIDLTQYDLRDRDQKWSFQQHYGLLGLTAHYEATRDERSEEYMNKGIRSIYENMWDARKGYEGYYDTADANWSNKRNKGFTATIDAVTTHAELSYLITENPEYKTRLTELADIVVDRFIPQMDNPAVKVLYPEVYNTNWSVDLNASKNGSIGHFIKTAWCLGRAFLCDPTEEEYRKAAVKILDQTWTYKNGDVSIWDHVNGGPFNEINILTGEWSGSNGNSKDYWTVEQGFTGPMLNYYITGNDIYLRMADESIDFFMTHFVDPVDGEIFYYLDPTGTIVKRGVKGDDYKASYHSIELGYYAYLYSNLYYLNAPANLYYMFQPKDEEQNIPLSPIPMEEGKLYISSVSLNGEPFESFNPETRTLNLAPNQGGKFKVTFAPKAQGSSLLPEILEEDKITVFPNPVKNFVKVSGLLDVTEIMVADITGKTVYRQKITESAIEANLSELTSGIYFISVCYNSGKTSTRKIIKL